MTLNMSASTGGGAPKIKKNASRKNKKSWRKNVDMSAVEEYLEEKRFDERIGKIIFSYRRKTFCYKTFRFAGVLHCLSAVCFQQCCSQCCGSRSDCFGPSGSGSFHHREKIVRKTLISIVLWLLFDDFLSSINDVNVPSKSIKQKTLKKGYFFVSILKVTDIKSRIRVRTKMSRIHNTGCSFGESWSGLRQIGCFLLGSVLIHLLIRISDPVPGFCWRFGKNHCVKK